MRLILIFAALLSGCAQRADHLPPGLMAAHFNNFDEVILDEHD